MLLGMLDSPSHSGNDETWHPIFRPGLDIVLVSGDVHPAEMGEIKHIGGFYLKCEASDLPVSGEGQVPIMIRLAVHLVAEIGQG